MFSVGGGYEVGVFLKEASNCIVQGCTFKNLTKNFSEAQPANSGLGNNVVIN